MIKIRNTSTQYGAVAKLLHWAIGLTIIGLLAVGLYMTGMENGPDKYSLYAMHKALGMLVLFAVGFRLFWRLVNRTPSLPQNMHMFETLGAHAGHLALYVFMFAMPLTGWLMFSAGGYPVSVFGWFTLPPLVGKSKELGGVFHEVHEVLGYVLIATIIVHVLAALYHHVWRKDNVLRRMLPW